MDGYALGQAETDDAWRCCYQCQKAGYTETTEGHYRESKGKCICISKRKLRFQKAFSFLYSFQLRILVESIENQRVVFTLFVKHTGQEKRGIRI